MPTRRTERYGAADPPERPGPGTTATAPSVSTGADVPAPVGSDIVADGAAAGGLGLQLALSAWLHGGNRTVTDACTMLLTLRDALLATSELDVDVEPIPLLAGDERTATIGLCVYVDGLVERAARSAGVTRAEAVSVAVGTLGFDTVQAPVGDSTDTDDRRCQSGLRSTR